MKIQKYKKAHSVVHSFAVCLGALAAALSSAGLATALTGIGVIASVPLASVAAISGFSSGEGKRRNEFAEWHVA